MDYDTLKKALNEVIDPESEDFKKAVAKSEKFPPELSRSVMLHDLSGSVADQLKTEPEFEKGFMVNFDNGSGGFQADRVAPKLVDLALTESGQTAVEWLEKVLATESASGIVVSVVWGLAANSVIRLNDELSIVPISDLQDSPQKEALTHWQLPDTHLGHFPHHFSPLPTAAIVRTVTIDPLLWDLNTDEEREKSTDGLVSHSMLSDARSALTLVSKVPLVEAIHWFQFDDPDIQHASLGSGTGSYSHEILPQMFEEGQPLNENRARAIVDAFSNLAPDVRDRVLILLARFNQALLRRMSGDKAVELSIALEALLMDDRGEHTHKVGMRAALLAGGTPEQRTHNRSIVTAIYGLRSALMHSGHVPPKGSVKGEAKKKPDDVVNEGISIVRRVIRNIVEAGQIPNWWELEVTTNDDVESRDTDRDE